MAGDNASGRPDLDAIRGRLSRPDFDAIDVRHDTRDLLAEVERLRAIESERWSVVAMRNAALNEAERLRDGIERLADHADKLTHLPATVIAPDLRALLDDREETT